MVACAITLGLWLAVSRVDVADAALVYLADRDQPVAGYVDQSDPQVVVVRDVLPNGQTRELRFPRDQVQDIVATVATDRLEDLSPSDPTSYRDYAEELAEIAEKQGDPEARDTSLRLFLVAAQLDRERLGRGCLLGMAEIAATAAEARRYRAMAYLLDPLHNRNVLDMDRRDATGGEAPLAEGDEMVLRAFQALRRDDARRARLLAEQPGFEEALAKWSKVITYDEFLNAARGGLKPTVLRKLLQVELAIQESGRPGNAPGQSGTAGWSDTVRQLGTPPGFGLDLATITRWDPAECVFRGGRWTKPQARE
jgi:hypothetical protein